MRGSVDGGEKETCIGPGCVLHELVDIVGRQRRELLEAVGSDGVGHGEDGEAKETRRVGEASSQRWSLVLGETCKASGHWHWSFLYPTEARSYGDEGRWRSMRGSWQKLTVSSHNNNAIECHRSINPIDFPPCIT